MTRQGTKSKKGRYMKLVIALILFQVIVYTWVHLYLSYTVGLEIAPTTTIGFYGFCGFEAGICGYLKRGKQAPTNTTRNEEDI